MDGDELSNGGKGMRRNSDELNARSVDHTFFAQFTDSEGNRVALHSMR